jgi:hypothetical protein
VQRLIKQVIDPNACEVANDNWVISNKVRVKDIDTPKMAPNENYCCYVKISFFDIYSKSCYPSLRLF